VAGESRAPERHCASDADRTSNADEVATGRDPRTPDAPPVEEPPVEQPPVEQPPVEQPPAPNDAPAAAVGPAAG
jgi:hypothetical protein